MSLTITLTNGYRYGASNIRYVYDKDGKDVITFDCSGTVMFFKKEEIAKIEA